MDKRIGSFERYVLVICMLVAVAFLLQLGFSEFNFSPTGAVISHLQDVFELIGPPASDTKLVTGTSPTTMEAKVADYYASNYALCGDGTVDAVEDCEPEYIYSSQEERIIGVKDCANCKICGDGKATYLDMQTGLIEQCDPGDSNFIPAISAVNSCSNNGQCQSSCSCPSGTISTNLCAYGIYKTIGTNYEDTWEYEPVKGNLVCEQGEGASTIDCASVRTTCGIGFEEMYRADMNAPDTMTKAEVITGFVQAEGVSQDIAEILFDTFSLQFSYPLADSSYISYTLKVIKFSNNADLLIYLNFTSSEFNPINSVIDNFNVYISNSTNIWVWYRGNMLFILDYYEPGQTMDTLILTMQQKQQGNTVILAYLNQFGSDVGVTTPPPSGPVICGDATCEGDETAFSCPDDCPAVCGDMEVTHDEICDPSYSSCRLDNAGKCSGDCSVCNPIIIEQDIGSVPPYTTYTATSVVLNEDVAACPLIDQLSSNPYAAISNRYTGYYEFDAFQGGSTVFVNIMEAVTPYNMNDIVLAEIITSDMKSAYEGYCQFTENIEGDVLIYENDVVSDNSIWLIWRSMVDSNEFLISIKITDTAFAGLSYADVIAATGASYTGSLSFAKATQAIEFMMAYQLKYVPSGAQSPAPFCGDGNIDAGEQCDDGNAITETCTYGQTSCTVCSSTCQNVAGSTSYCGDGTIDIGAGEQCDDGSQNSDTIPDACRTDCKNAYCGDGVQDTGEACDDGNTNDNDGCSGLCQIVVVCTETDGGNDAANMGITTKGAVSNTDVCTSADVLLEYYCTTANAITSISYNCKAMVGYSRCYNGACV